MQDFKKTKTKLVEAVAVARDATLVKVGKDAEARQDQRASKSTQRKAGKAAMALIELRQNIVKHDDGGLASHICHQLGFGELHRQHRQALLTS